MRPIELASLMLLLFLGNFCSADDAENTPAKGERFAIDALRQAGAEVTLDAQDRAISVTWGMLGSGGSKGSFTDKHLQHVATLTHLNELWLEHTLVTDAGLACLKPLQQLETLCLACEYKRGQPTTITDAGMKHLSGLTRLRVLRLDDSDVTDAGLVHLKSLTNLEDLDLFGTNISDAGLVHLQGLKKLTFLGISETQWERTGGAITPAAARALQLHLPGCHLYY